MAKLFKKKEAVHFKNEEEKKQLLDIAVKHGFIWNSNKHPFAFEIPSGNDCLMFKENKTLYFTYSIRVNEMGNKLVSTKKFLKRFEEGDKVKLEDRVRVLEDIVANKRKSIGISPDEVGIELEIKFKDHFDRIDPKAFEVIKATPHIVSDKNGQVRQLEHSVGFDFSKVKLAKLDAKSSPKYMTDKEALDYQTKMVEYVVGELDKAESAKIKRHLEVFKNCLETAEAIIKSCQESVKQTSKTLPHYLKK